MSGIDLPIVPPKTAPADWTVGRVMQYMLEEDISTLLIVDGTGKMLGLVSESALLAAAFDAPLRADPISLHMQRKFASVRRGTPVAEVVETFLLHRVRHLPVVDQNQQPVGIISRRELLRRLFQRSDAGIAG